MAKVIPPHQIRYQEGDLQLFFEPPQVSQAEAIAAAIAETLTELKPQMPWSHDPQPPAVQQERLRSTLASYWNGEDYVYSVFDAQGDFILGAGLHARVPLNPAGLEIGYWVRKKYQGQGLATLATKILVLVTVEWFGCDRVQISHNVDNDGSRRVIEKVGFRFEGVIRNNEAPRTEVQLAGGMSPNRDARGYGLLPEDLVELDWVDAVRRGIRIVDHRGELLPLGS